MPPIREAFEQKYFPWVWAPERTSTPGPRVDVTHPPTQGPIPATPMDLDTSDLEIVTNLRK